MNTRNGNLTWNKLSLNSECKKRQDGELLQNANLSFPPKLFNARNVIMNQPQGGIDQNLENQRMLTSKMFLHNNGGNQIQHINKVDWNIRIHI
jgi:hypothetical protein